MERELLRGLAEIGDAGLPEAGLGLDHFIHALPQPQALDDQRQLARVASHLAAPAPVAARLLAGDVPLLAEHRRNALPREEESGAGADDAAADDDDAGTARQGIVGGNGIDTRRHRWTSRIS